MVGLENTVLNEETKLGDFKRSETKEALSLKLGALLELAENSTVIAELGKLLLASISVERTEPGANRPYYSPDKTDSIMQEAHRCIQEVVFSPVPADGERRFDVDDDRRYEQHDQDREREQGDFSPPQTHERRESGGAPQSFYQQQSYGSQGVPHSQGGRDQELSQSQSHYREAAQSRLDSQQQYNNLSTPVDRRGEEERTEEYEQRTAEYEQRTSGDNLNDSTSAWRTQGHGTTSSLSNPSFKTATPLYSTFSTSGNANRGEEPRIPVLTEPLHYRSSPPHDADPHRSSLAYADTAESNHRDSREAAARPAVYGDSTQTDSRELDSNDNAVYDTSYSHSREYPSHHTSTGSNAPTGSSTRYDAAPELHHSAPSYSTAAPTPVASTQKAPSPPPISPVPQAPKSYYSERPYVPKEGDGAYHPQVSTPAVYAPQRTESPQIPPQTFSSAPLDSATNSFYSSPNVPQASTTQNIAATPSSPRTRAPLIRGESALGSKHGDLYVAGAPTPTPVATSTGPFQGAGRSGYNSRVGGGDEVSVGSGGGGRVNAGAFRRPAGGSQPQGYSYNMPQQDRERDAQRPGLVGPSQSDLIRDSYRAQHQANPTVLAPALSSTTRDEFETPSTLVAGGSATESTAPVAPTSRFEISPLHINKQRAASRNNTVDESRNAGGYAAHGREGAEGSIVGEGSQAGEYLPRYAHQSRDDEEAYEGQDGRSHATGRD